MFPLFAKVFPNSTSDLERLLNESLQRLFVVEAAPVIIRAASYPRIEEMRVTLDGARLREDLPQSRFAGTTSPALRIDQMSINASAFAIGPATVTFSLSASDVRLGQGKDADDQIVLAIESAKDGNIIVSVAPSDIEALIAAIAKHEAGKHGVAIDGVQLGLRRKDSHSLALEVQLRARKLFLAATIGISAQLDLDEQLNARISDVKCAGDGAFATLACGLLAPHLQKIDGRTFALMSLPLGEVRLRDVQISVGDRLTVEAQFGNVT